MLKSNSALRRAIAGAAVAAALMSPLPASAASYVLSATNVDPTAGTTTGPSGPNNTQTYQLTLSFDGMPSTIASGDDFTLSVGFSSPWTVPAGTTQILGLTFLTNPDKTGAGTTADGILALNGASIVALAQCGNCLAFLWTNNPGGPSLSIDDLFVTGILEFAGDPAALLGIALTYTVENANETPLPAALPLFASGLAVMGFVARRRKRKALERAAP